MCLVMEEKSFDFNSVSSFAENFREHFPRAEQARWFAIYLWGLLETKDRKTIEAIARSLPEELIPTNTSPSQSLQHFLTQSPWDEAALLRTVRSRLGTIGESGATWVIHDVVIFKRGKQSVGVRRQYLRSQGLKANCQTGVLISQVGSSGYVPLALRLYLPRGWLESASELQKRHIPEENLRAPSKDELALQLIDGLLAEGTRPDFVAAALGYGTTHVLEDGLRERQLSLSNDPNVRPAADRGCEWLKDQLGLDHFEGRSWRGWHHHAASVLAACSFILLERPDAGPQIEFV
jgi:SRSO17 transposase